MPYLSGKKRFGECETSLASLVEIQDDLNTTICKLEKCEDYSEEQQNNLQSEYSDISSKAQAVSDIAKVAKKRHWAFLESLQ